MLPHLRSFGGDESGIKRVIEHYFNYAKEFDIEYVEQEPYDLAASHAGTMPGADVAICHGLYWTADYSADGWEWEMNERVIKVLRLAKEITVPSSWVAETIKREMRVSPHVIGHGVEWDEWQEPCEKYNYILWNKNRISDVCTPIPVSILAKKYPHIKFFATFYTPNEIVPENVRVSGVIPHSEMRAVIKQAGIYLATTKETFGIGTLEAMASGCAILGFAHGGNLDLVKHGINGYLASPNNYEDLCSGLEYCLANHVVLGKNSRELARQWTWRAACEKLRNVYDLAMDKKFRLPYKIPESEYKV